MIRRLNNRHVWLMVSAVLFALAVALPVAAQSNGLIRGTVKDMSGAPVEGATVSIDAIQSNRHFETKTDKKGEFIQIGLPPVVYNVRAEKNKITSPTVSKSVRVASSPPMTLVLGEPAAVGSAEANAKTAAMKKAFADGVGASQAGNHDEAIARFQEALVINSECFDCHSNIAFAQMQKKDYDAAEASYKKAIELNPNYGQAYEGLANLYNATRKFDLAAAASAKSALVAVVLRFVIGLRSWSRGRGRLLLLLRVVFLLFLLALVVCSAGLRVVGFRHLRGFVSRRGGRGRGRSRRRGGRR